MSFTIVKPPETDTRAKSKGGAPTKGEKKLIFKSIGLIQEEWDWMHLFEENSEKPTDWARELVARFRPFAPEGPNKFGHKGKQPKYRMPNALSKFAKERGLTSREAAALIVQQHFAKSDVVNTTEPG